MRIVQTYTYESADAEHGERIKHIAETWATDLNANREVLIGRSNPTYFQIADIEKMRQFKNAEKVGHQTKISQLEADIAPLDDVLKAVPVVPIAEEPMGGLPA